MNNFTSDGKYNIKEFIKVYKQDIGIILGIVIRHSENKGFKIKNKENLFKNIVDMIYINSDKRKLKYDF